MRGLVWLVISVCLGVAVLLLLRTGVTVTTTRVATGGTPVSGTTPAGSRVDSENIHALEQPPALASVSANAVFESVALAPAGVAPLPPELAELPPEMILENLRSTIRLYHSSFGENPVGNNREITAALNGGNTRQVVFLQQDGNRISSRGELVDPWGTPYFFHQLSGQNMEIRSAGPDKTLWNEDDLVTR